jgi:hypothetical protein
MSPDLKEVKQSDDNDVAWSPAHGPCGSLILGMATAWAFDGQGSGPEVTPVSWWPPCGTQTQDAELCVFFRISEFVGLHTAAWPRVQIPMPPSTENASLACPRLGTSWVQGTPGAQRDPSSAHSGGPGGLVSWHSLLPHFPTIFFFFSSWPDWDLNSRPRAGFFFFLSQGLKNDFPGAGL